MTIPSCLECATIKVGEVLGGSYVLPGDHGSVYDRFYSSILLLLVWQLRWGTMVSS